MNSISGGHLQGIRVLEMAHFVFGPATGAVLSDWGAEVIKIEHPTLGDPSRGVAVYGLDPGSEGLSCLFDTYNRGKRDVTIDASTSEGHNLVLELASRADVFLTSFLPGVRRKLGLDITDVMQKNPRIIYALASGQGSLGPDAELPGFDLTSFWYRSGLSAGATPAEMPYALGLPSPGFGDTATGSVLAGAVAAALYRRTQTDEGSVVEASLLESGLFLNQAAFAACDLHGRAKLPPAERSWVSNPLVNVYRTSDSRFVALSMLQADRYWAEFCRAVGRPELIDDPLTSGAEQRAANSAYCVAQLDGTFASAPLSEWIKRLSKQSGPWTVVQSAAEAKADPQAVANGYLVRVAHSSGRELTVVPAPGRGQGAAPVRNAPGFGADTDQVLQEMLGLDMERIIELKISGAVG